MILCPKVDLAHIYNERWMGVMSSSPKSPSLTPPFIPGKVVTAGLSSASSSVLPHWWKPSETGCRRFSVFDGKRKGNYPFLETWKSNPTWKRQWHLLLCISQHVNDDHIVLKMNTWAVPLAADGRVSNLQRASFSAETCIVCVRYKVGIRSCAGCWCVTTHSLATNQLYESLIWNKHRYRSSVLDPSPRWTSTFVGLCPQREGAREQLWFHACETSSQSWRKKRTRTHTVRSADRKPGGQGFISGTSVHVPFGSDSCRPRTWLIIRLWTLIPRVNWTSRRVVSSLRQRETDGSLLENTPIEFVDVVMRWQNMAAPTFGPRGL